MNFLQKAIFEAANEFPSTFFFKTIWTQNEGWFWVLKTLSEQNTGKSLPIATVWLLLRHFTKYLDFLTGTICLTFYGSGLEIIMRLEVSLVLIYKVSVAEWIFQTIKWFFFRNGLKQTSWIEICCRLAATSFQKLPWVCSSTEYYELVLDKNNQNDPESRIWLIRQAKDWYICQIRHWDILNLHYLLFINCPDLLTQPSTHPCLTVCLCK